MRETRKGGYATRSSHALESSLQAHAHDRNVITPFQSAIARHQEISEHVEISTGSSTQKIFFPTAQVDFPRVPRKVPRLTPNKCVSGLLFMNAPLTTSEL